MEESSLLLKDGTSKTTVLTPPSSAIQSFSRKWCKINMHFVYLMTSWGVDAHPLGRVIKTFQVLSPGWLVKDTVSIPYIMSIKYTYPHSP